MTSHNALRAFFYLLEAEPQPKEAEDAWFLLPDPSARTLEEIAVFAKHAALLLDDLAPLDTEEAFQVAFYDRAKQAFGTDKDAIRTFFQLLYMLLLHRPQGPRWGQFVSLIGKDAFCTMLRNRLDNPLSFPSPTA